MGIRQGGYATVWEVVPKTQGVTQARVTTSVKNKATGEYKTDFSGYVSFLGSAVASEAAKLKEKDRIKIGACETTREYNKDRNETYWGVKIYEFEMVNFENQESNQPSVDNGEVDESDLPF